MAGESSKQWADDLVFTTLTNGFDEKCYDGKTFYATNHEVGEGKNKKLVFKPPECTFKRRYIGCRLKQVMVLHVPCNSIK